MALMATIQGRFLAAIAAGLAGCHESQTSTVDVAPLPTPAQTSSATASASASTSAAPVQTTDATAPSSPRPRASLKCPDGAKLERRCVAPNTPPDTGGNIAPTGPYTGFDSNGCYAAQAIQTACNGIPVARGPFFANGRCCFDVCQGTPAPCGRPLLVDGRARLAPVVSRADWSAARLDLRGGSDEIRSCAGRAWREDAAVEHASVAAFARLSLQLLALGAPSDLVVAAHQAALQEIDHARACFAMAAALGDEAPLGPAPLAIDGVALTASLVSVAREAALESCIGETVSSLVLSRAARTCAAEAQRAMLEQMAEDELEHAAFGWKVVAWACRVGGEPVYDAVADALVVRDFDAAAMVGGDAVEWRHFGRITRDDMVEVLRDASAVVAEARRALLS